MFLQIENDLSNLSGIERVSFSEYPDYVGQWRADVYFFGDQEAAFTLPHTFATEEQARSFAAAAIGHAFLTGVCTLEDQESICAQVLDGSSQT